MTGDEPTLADVQRETGWECWRGISGRCYARKAAKPRRHKADAEGEDPRDLWDMIIAAKARDELATHAEGDV